MHYATYAVLQTKSLASEESQLNRDADFQPLMCSLFIECFLFTLKYSKEIMCPNILGILRAYVLAIIGE